MSSTISHTQTYSHCFKPFISRTEKFARERIRTIYYSLLYFLFLLTVTMYHIHRGRTSPLPNPSAEDVCTERIISRQLDTQDVIGQRIDFRNVARSCVSAKKAPNSASYLHWVLVLIPSLPSKLFKATSIQQSLQLPSYSRSYPIRSSRRYGQHNKNWSPIWSLKRCVSYYGAT